MNINVKSEKFLQEIKDHLFADNNRGVEQALFLFAKYNQDREKPRLEVIDCLLLKKDDFTIQSRWHIELKDEVRSKIIKQGHDLNASIIEVHSHIEQQSAQFSESDLYGFQEFVPHMLWRLKDRPYTALVFGPNNFDAITWHHVSQPEKISAITFGQVKLFPTNNTLKDINHE